MSSTITKALTAKPQEQQGVQQGIPLYGEGGLFTSPEELRNVGMDEFIMERDRILWGNNAGTVGIDPNTGLTIEYSGRPSSFLWRMEGKNTAYFRCYNLMDFYRNNVQILATIITRPVMELLRYGIDWDPRFVVRCRNCGHEYKERISKCDICMCTEFDRPDEHQKEYFIKPGTNKTFIQEANDNGQTLKSVVQSYAELQFQDNQAYILRVDGDVVNEDGKIEDKRPLEYITYDPKFVRKLFDGSAKPGTELGFTADDRLMAIPLASHLDQLDERGKQIYPAYYAIGDCFGATGKTWYYAKDEIFCDNWFSQSMTYGVPPWLDSEDDILCYYYHDKTELVKYQYGTIRGLLVLPGFNQESLKKTMQGLRDSLRKNNNSIPAIATPMPLAGSQLQVQFIPFNTDNGSDRLASKNDIKDRLCGRVGVPKIIVTDTESSGGLNNESQQITVFDRALMDKYDRIDGILDWVLEPFRDRITDWNLRVRRPPKADTDMKDKRAEAEYADLMVNRLHFGITSYRNGKFEFTERPLNQPGEQQGTSSGGFGGSTSFGPSFR